MINTKLLYSYLTFGRGRFWKKYSSISFIQNVSFFNKNAIFKILVIHLDMNRFHWNFTEAFFIWNGTFSPMEQHILEKKGILCGLTYVWNSDVCKINIKTLHVEFVKKWFVYKGYRVCVGNTQQIDFFT